MAVTRKGGIDPDFVNRAKRRWLEEAGIAIQGQAQELAPYDLGNLKGSIAYRVEHDTTIIFTPVEYAPYQEYGTWKMEAQPFMRPAMDLMRGPLISKFRSYLKEEV